MKCVKNENFDGLLKIYHNIQGLNNFNYPIPDNNIEICFKIIYNFPDKWDIENADYIKTKDDEYLIIFFK